MCAISIVMPCHNRSTDLAQVLLAYEQQEGEVPFEIIAVDDGSTDNTSVVLSTYRPARFSLKIKRLPQSQGPATARNQGIALAQYPIIMFVGDDILPSPNLIQGHYEAHKTYPEKEFAILGRLVWPTAIPVNALMKHIDGKGAQQFSYFYMRDGLEYDYRHFYTANISLKREMLLKLDHWFDTTFPYAAFEDAELAFRLAKQGMQIIYKSHLIGYHYHYHTVWSFSSRQYKSGLAAWFFIKKHPVVAWKLLSPFHKRLLALSLLKPSTISYPALEQMEKDLLHLASFYEWTPSSHTDSLFLILFDYFYFKGLTFAAFGVSHIERKILNAYIDYGLRPRIYQFLNLVRPQELPFLMKVMEVSK